MSSEWSLQCENHFAQAPSAGYTTLVSNLSWNLFWAGVALDCRTRQRTQHTLTNCVFCWASILRLRIQGKVSRAAKGIAVGHWDKVNGGSLSRATDKIMNCTYLVLLIRTGKFLNPSMILDGACSLERFAMQ